MAFHSYAHLIQKLFNAYWCGPPYRVTGTSPWTCVDHSVSRPPHPTKNALFRLAFTAGTRLSRLASPDMVTRRFIMQKARRHPKKGLRPLVGAWFQVLFHSPPGGPFHRSLTVLSTIGLTGVFSLAGWSRRIHAGFLVPRATQDDAWAGVSSGKGLSPAAVQLSRCFPSTLRSRTAILQPPGLFPVRSPLLRESLVYFLFLGVLRCFSSPGSPPRYKAGIAALQAAGLSHSEIPGSKVICT